MVSKKEKSVVLIDGHSLAYRSFYAFIRNPLRNSKGQNTSAIFGFVNSLRKILNKFSPQYMAVIFDSGKETFRHKLYEEYKKERPETPGDLVSQLPLIKEVVSAYGIKVLEKEGFEADDILATIAKRLAKKGTKVYIVTSDKDLFQIIDENIFIYDVYKDIIYDKEKTKEKYGINDPSLMRDLLALAGDAIDNIPGVPGIGLKRALDIIHRYSSFEEALEKDERLKEHRQLAEISRILATIKTDVKTKIGLKELQIRKKSIPKLIKIFQELEFSSFLKELSTDMPKTVYQEPLFKDKAHIALKRKGIWGFKFSNQTLFVCDGEVDKKITDKDKIKEFLNSSEFKVGFDIKSQMHKLKEFGCELALPYFDTQIAAWLLDPTRKRYEFSDLMLHNFKLMPKMVSDTEQARLNLMLFQKLEPEILTFGLDKILYEIEMPLIKILYEMEERGVKIDTGLFKRLSTEIEIEKIKLKKSIYQQAGVEFNINSPQQLAKVLFEKLKLPKTKKTKTGFSTDSSVLAELAGSAPIVRDILRYREITKLQTTYLTPMQGLIKHETGRIHCQFNQTGTATGRLSSSNPNLQNIPIKGELGKKIREGFIAEPENLLISADYSQIELRILAYISNDEKLKEAFINNEDIHLQTATMVFNKPKDKVTNDERQIAKMVNYGLIYGLSDYGLASSLGISNEEARNIIDEFLGIYFQVAEWRQKIIEQTKETGYGKTIFGRIRPFPGIFAQNRTIYESTVRAAINHPIQGSAADIIKKAMIEIDQEMKNKNFCGGMIIQVHDELLFEVEKNRIKEAQMLIKEIMSKNYLDDVPLVVNIGIGENWAVAHETAK
ncbi:MAG: DNA polymerase I [candidate division WOR-3 bacterium]